MNLAPKWAREAAILGLELNIKIAVENGSLTTEQAREFRDRIARLPRD